MGQKMRENMRNTENEELTIWDWLHLIASLITIGFTIWNLVKFLRWRKSWNEFNDEDFDESAWDEDEDVEDED